MGCTIHIEYDSGGGWTDIAGSISPCTEDCPIMILFEDITCNAVRVSIAGAGGHPRIGIIHFGHVLELTRPIRWMGHTPARFKREFDKRPNESARGQRLGTSITRMGLSGEFDVENLDETWVRNTFDLFIVNSMKYGYFLAWRPDQFPDEVFYGWTDKPIIPVNSVGGVNRKMRVSWPMDIHYPENVTAWSSS
jgi:hypothetical protein